MWWNKKKELDVDELHVGVFTEVATWYKVECLLDPEKADNSWLFSLAAFNLGSLTSAAGQQRLDALLAPKINSFSLVRMRDLVVGLYAKFGVEAIEGLIARTLHGIMVAHRIPMPVLLKLQKREPAFWLIPFCNTCYRMNLPRQVMQAASLQQ